MTAATVDVDVDEVRRQAAVVDAVRSTGPWLAAARVAPGQRRAERALGAWRAQALALADKALRPIFPTVRCMLGDTDFARLAAEFRAAHPPTCGDLGEWGGAMPAFVEAHRGLLAWPWLGDTARLDLALHRNERAADAQIDPASLMCLQTTAPARLRLVLAPGTAVLVSGWPLAAIHAAHRAADADAAFAVLRGALELERGESVMIVREGWRASVHRLEPAGVDWLRSLLDGRSLADALDRAGAGFDFAGWLAAAVGRHWLERVVEVDANGSKEGSTA